jgi:flavin-dependent dehydrogenase
LSQEKGLWPFKTSSEDCEVLVIGGGPAGCTAARLLSLWGRDVVLVARPPARERDLPESLTPSCQKLFDLMQIAPAIEQEGFVRSTGHTVWWGTADTRIEPFADGARGWQVSSGRLSRVMLAQAAASGARVRYGVPALDDVVAWPARYRLDCTGRAGVLAKPYGQRHYEAGHRTVALVGVWRRDDAWPLDDPSHTLLESYEDGWAWSVPLDAHDRALAVMVDPRTSALARGEALARGDTLAHGEHADTVYRAEVGKTRHLARCVDGAALVDRPAGWDASMYRSTTLTGDDWLLVGDAGSFVDPLSSAGVKKAMASAWLAAVAVNTALTDAAMTGPAFDLFRTREAATYRRFLDLTRAHLADAGRGAPDPHPFWSDRSAAADPGAEPGLDRTAIEDAFDRLKYADSLLLRRSPGVRIETRPALGERLMTLEPHLVTDELPEGVRFVLDVDVAVLVDAADRARDVPSLHGLYIARAGPVSWPTFLTALATAIARNWLILG